MGIDHWLLPANGHGLIRWDSYTLTSDTTFELPGVGSIDMDSWDLSAVNSIVSAGGVRTEGIIDFSTEDDPESENGPWIAPYTCDGKSFQLSRGGQSVVYYLVEHW